MAQSKEMKRKEYGTDILSHGDKQEPQVRNIRFNNTFKSNVFVASEDYSRKQLPKSRDRLFQKNPLTS